MQTNISVSAENTSDAKVMHKNSTLNPILNGLTMEIENVWNNKGIAGNFSLTK